MPSSKQLWTDQAPQGLDQDTGSQSPHQGQYLSRTLRPQWANPSHAQRPLAPPATQGPANEAPSAGTASFHDDLPRSRVSTHLPDLELDGAPSRVVGVWDGVVTGIGRETFKARVVPIGIRGPEQAVEFSIFDVSDSDMDLFELGAIFYWTIAHRTTTFGRVRRVSEVRFRRLPPPPRRESDERWVAEAMNLFNGERETRSAGS